MRELKNGQASEAPLVVVKKALQQQDDSESGSEYQIPNAKTALKFAILEHIFFFENGLLKYQALTPRKPCF